MGECPPARLELFALPCHLVLLRNLPKIYFKLAEDTRLERARQYFSPNAFQASSFPFGYPPFKLESVEGFEPTKITELQSAALNHLATPTYFFFDYLIYHVLRHDNFYIINHIYQVLFLYLIIYIYTYLLKTSYL